MYLFFVNTNKKFEKYATFSDTYYWMREECTYLATSSSSSSGESNSGSCTSIFDYDFYSHDLEGNYYIYIDYYGGETDNNLKSYINNYRNYLVDQGLPNNIAARLMSYEEAR